jgi:hypothetical protein
VKVAGLSVKELAALVSTGLARGGVDAVMSGGSCVTVYSAGRYVSRDLDFVLVSSSPRKVVDRALSAVGFRPRGRIYEHRDTDMSVDVMPPPLSVGGEPVREVRSMKVGTRRLRLLSPTDCVKDRLAAFIHWDDRQALAQALMVCRARKVDVAEVRRWARAEGAVDKFRQFERELRRRGGHRLEPR